MSRRDRIIRYGAAAVLVIAGVACGALLSGTAGGTLATVLIGIGLVLAVGLVFYEVGLSEDRDRAEHPPGGPAVGHGSELEAGAERSDPDTGLRPASGPRHGPGLHTGQESHPAREGMRPRPPDRMRGRRRRLR